MNKSSANGQEILPQLGNHDSSKSERTSSIAFQFGKGTKGQFKSDSGCSPNTDLGAKGNHTIRQSL